MTKKKNDDSELFAAVLLRKFFYAQQPILFSYELINCTIAFLLCHCLRQIFYKGLQPKTPFTALHRIKPFLFGHSGGSGVDIVSYLPVGKLFRVTLELSQECIHALH